MYLKNFKSTVRFRPRRTHIKINVDDIQDDYNSPGLSIDNKMSTDGMRARLAADIARAKYERTGTADYTAFLVDVEDYLARMPSHRVRGMYYDYYSQDVPNFVFK